MSTGSELLILELSPADATTLAHAAMRLRLMPDRLAEVMLSAAVRGLAELAVARQSGAVTVEALEPTMLAILQRTTGELRAAASKRRHRA